MKYVLNQISVENINLVATFICLLTQCVAEKLYLPGIRPPVQLIVICVSNRDDSALISF